jgi:uncharacterized repeat protein (TIGR02543 family)
MDGNKTVTATFAVNTYTLTVALVGSGSVAKSPDRASYDHGTSVQLTAVPATGWHFTGWSGDLSGNTNPTTIVMNSDKTVTATFTQNQYTLTANVTGSGSVTRNPDLATYTYGTSVQLTAVPATGWHFTGWSGDLSGNTNPTTIVMNSDKTVTATFTRNENSFQNFVISQMTIDWAKDTNNPYKGWGWDSWFKWFGKPTHKDDDTFSISGRLKLADGYTVADLKESVVVTISIADGSGHDTVGFRELNLKKAGVMWQYKGSSHPPGGGLKIIKTTIWWAPQTDDWAGWAGFTIDGVLELPESIGVDTTPAEATVVMEIPVSAEGGSGSLLGEETVKFRVPNKSNQWYYSRLKLPRFQYEP